MRGQMAEKRERGFRKATMTGQHRPICAATGVRCRMRPCIALMPLRRSLAERNTSCRMPPYPGQQSPVHRPARAHAQRQAPAGPRTACAGPDRLAGAVACPARLWSAIQAYRQACWPTSAESCQCSMRLVGRYRLVVAVRTPGCEARPARTSMLFGISSTLSTIDFRLLFCRR